MEERRRSPRHPAESLSVCLNDVGSGHLVNLSETGALVRVTSPPAATNVMLTIRLSRTSVALAARVVRAALRRVDDAVRRTWSVEYEVGLAFIDHVAVAAVVRQIIELGESA